MHFPVLAGYAQETNEILAERYGLKPEFGLFWNFCVNAPFPQAGVQEVICRPHLDGKNAAIMLCVVLVYYIGPRKPPIPSSFSKYFAQFL